MAVIVGPAPNVSTTGTGTKVGTVQTRDVYGVTIPISAGERAFEGHIIWASDYYQTQVVETRPSEIINGVPVIWGFIAHDTLCMDFAVSFGYHLVPEDERGDVGLFKLWADDQLIFDAGSPTIASTEYSFKVYRGLSDQNVDPTILAALEERGVPFRNQIYIVFKGYPLAHGDAASANIVAGGTGVNPWRPTHSPLGELPVIRAEFVDGLSITSGTTDFEMLTASTIWESGTIWDWDNGLAYGWSAINGAAASLHTFDIYSEVELSSVPVTGTYSNLVGLDTVNLFDKNNGVAICARNGIPNTAPIVAIDLQTGAINDSFGTGTSTELHPSDTTPTSTLSSGNPIANIPYPLAGDMAYLLDGQIMRTVAVLGSLRWDVSLLPVQDGGVFPSDLGLAEKDFEKGGAAIKLPDNEDIHFITCYPFTTFGDQVSGAQDGLAIVGAGTKLYGIQFGFRQVGGVACCKVLGFGLIKDFTVDNPGYEPQHCFVDPNDRGIIVFLANAGTWTAIKYLPAVYDYYPASTWGANGAAFGEWKGRWPAVDAISIIPSYKIWERSIPPFNTSSGDYNALRSSNFGGGTFAWNDGVNHNIMQLSTGEVNSIVAGVSNVDDYVWDSRTGLMYFPHGAGHTRPLGIFAVSSATGTPATIADYCRWILLFVGFAEDEIEIDAALTDPVTGILIDHPRDLNDIMRDLGEAYNFQYFESEGIAKVIRTVQATESDPGDAVFDLTIDDMCPVQENQVSDSDNLVTVLAGPQQQVASVSMQYSDLDQTFSWQVQTFNADLQSSGSVATGKLVLDLPIVMHRAEAFRRVTKIQTKKTASTDTHYFRLSQAYMQLEPSDLVTITKPPFRYGVRVDESTFNGDWSMSFSGSSFLFQDDIEIEDEATDGTGDTGRGRGNADAKPVALDMPLLYPAWGGNTGTIIITVGEFSYDQTTWTGAPLLYGQAPSGPFSSVGLFTTDTKYGLLVGTLADTEVPFQTDNTTTLRIALRTGTVDGSWLSTDADGLLEGENTIIVGAPGRWEVIYFRDVTKITDKVLTIAGLLRGRRGTEVNCGLHVANDQVILVRSAATGFVQGLRPHLIASDNLDDLLVYDARGVPSLRPYTPVNLRVAGYSQYPWAPSELRAKLGSHINLVAAPSYTNSGGTGERTGLITVTGNYTVQSLGSTPSNLVDGGLGNNTTDSIDFQNGQTTVEIIFDFTPTGMPQIITEYIWKQNTAVSIGTYAFEGSLDGDTWDTLDAGTNLGGSSSTTTVPFANATGYNYYRLLQVSGSTSSSPWCREIDFKIQADIGANDLKLTWHRRDRLDTGFFVEDAVELNEDDEEYSVDLMDGSDNVQRTVTSLDLPVYIYTSANQTTDGLTPPVSTVQLAVYQVSALTGRGLSRSEILDVE